MEKPTFLSCLFLLGLILNGCGGMSSDHGVVEGKKKLENAEQELKHVVYNGVAFENPESVAIERLIIKLKPSITNAKSFIESTTPSARLQTQQALSLLQQVGDNTYVMALDKRFTLRALMNVLDEIRLDPNVDYVEPDWPIYPMLTPTDPGYSNQWHMSERALVPGAANLPAAWDISTGHSEVVVAVLDSGIISNHPDLSERIVAGYDFIANLTRANDGDGRDDDPEDTGNWCDDPSASSNWHGTFVAGLVGAVANNAQGGVGVDWQAGIQPIRVLGRCGGFSSDLIDGIRWAAGLNINGIADNPTSAKVINLSLGGLGVCGTALQEAIDEAYNAGSILIAAAGNNDDVAANYTPAVCNNVITVAAIGRDGERASYSNYGARVDLSAPGGSGLYSVYSTGNDGAQGPNNNIYTTSQGTSAAAPHVAGIVSLMMGANYDLTARFLSPAQITDKLIATLAPFPTGTSRDCDTSLCGAGIIDAAAAVSAVTTAPNVDAGMDQNVSNAQAVSLTAVVTDDAAGPFSYLWTQTAGNSVALSGVTTDTLTFTSAATSEVLTFQVEVTDDVGLVSTDTVNVSVSGTNTAPTANDASLSVEEDLGGLGTLTGNDVDGNALTFSIVTPPENGAISSFDQNTGEYRYTPTSDYAGTDGFTFVSNDGLANSAEARVTITVNAVDDPPRAINETIRVTRGGRINAAVKGEDPDGDSLTYALLSGPDEGTVSDFNTLDGSFTYSPGSFEGTTQLVFSVSDANSPPVEGLLTLISEASPSIGINADIASPQTPGTTVAFTALSSEVGSFEYEFWLKGPGTGEVWRRVQAYSRAASWEWTTTNIDVGQSKIWVYSRLLGERVRFASSLIDYEIDDGNQGPTPTLTTLETQINTDRQARLMATDPENDELTFSMVSGPSNGAIISFEAATGVFVYRPDTGFSGVDSLVYAVSDTSLNTVNQTLTITVVSANNVPLAVPGVLSARAGVEATGRVLGTDADTTDTLSYAWESGPLHGVLTGPDPTTGTFSYLAPAGFSGSDQFTFSVDDGKVSRTARVTIEVVDQAMALLSTSLPSPQAAGLGIVFQASANSSDGSEFEFWLKGPGTSDAWQRMQAYSTENTWTWLTSSADIGTSSIWVYSREIGTTRVFNATEVSFTIE